MKRLFVLFLAVPLVASCAAKKEEKAAEGTTAGWPAGLSVTFDPADRTIAHGKKLKMWIENKTGTAYKFEWASEGKCGEFKFDQAKSFEALLVGGQFGEDCSEKVTISALSSGTPMQKAINVRVRGSKEFQELTVRPDPIPETWMFINDYDKTVEGREVKCIITIGGDGKSVGLAVNAAKKRKKTAEEEAADKKARESGQITEVEDFFDDVYLNLLGAPFDTWTYESGSCSFADGPEGEDGVMALRYDIPYHDAYCGYFENLGLGRDCEAQAFDATEYKALTFIAKSGDGAVHRFSTELVPWERFAEFHQGKARLMGPFEVGEKWKRFEIPLSDFCKDPDEIRRLKSVSFKFKREANFPDAGLLLIDNVALIKKEGGE